MYDGYNDEQEKEIMTNSTGSNNLAGLLGGLTEIIDSVVDFAGRNLVDGTQEADQTEGDGADRVTYKMVAEIALTDALVLDDAEWPVRGVEADAFDPDIVHILLENGESYALIRTALVRVV